ncbi:MAG: MBL fold metallo-hydrolase [Candidatus Thorarchaeota archaeon]|nr:MBL fold metallo-hydrolase [Candidatus Thorarchaeota archaeon]
MRVTLLGTGTSIPSQHRVQSGILVQIPSGAIMLDVGSGTLFRLNQMQCPVKSIKHIFITHTHVDHCSDLAPLIQTAWMQDYNDTLSIYGPPGIIAWFNELMDMVYPYLRSKVKVQVLEEPDRHVVQIGEATVSTCRTIHGTTNGRAIRIDHGGKSLVFSSDTAPSDEVAQLAAGVDLLIHECTWCDGNHPPNVHTSPTELGVVVNRAKPKAVVLTHMHPEVIEDGERTLAIVKGTSECTVRLGEDLMTIDI